jgi:hypothetical protein
LYVEYGGNKMNNCEKCSNYWSCKVIYDRFGVKLCEKDRNIKVNIVHEKEMEGIK